MDIKEAETETVKPVSISADEEVGQGRFDKVEVESETQDENVEYSYESNRSPFPEGVRMFLFCIGDID